MPAPLSQDSLENKRRQILDAARIVCERSGFDKCRMSEIAAEARVSKGTLYRFFENKEELLLATVMQTWEDLMPAFEALAKNKGGAQQRLQLWIDSTIAVFPETIDRMMMNFQALGAAGREPAGAEALMSTMKRSCDARQGAFETILRDGQVEGFVRQNIDIGLAAAVFVATTDGMFYRATFDRAYLEEPRLRSVFRSVLAIYLTDPDALFPPSDVESVGASVTPLHS